MGKLRQLVNTKAAVMGDSKALGVGHWGRPEELQGSLGSQNIAHIINKYFFKKINCLLLLHPVDWSRFLGSVGI